jgi:hypothetical protein
LSGRKTTTEAVNSVFQKMVIIALVHQSVAFYLCIQKLIDVQQTLIANPNPLKALIPLIREKP